MKQVFSNSQLCHIWANQSQDSGRNSGNSLFFEGNKIYSYGSHYLMAQIHTSQDGTKFALVNEYNYSMTTAKQRGHVNRALQGLMPSFYCTDPTEPLTAVLYHQQRTVDDIFSHFTSSKPYKDTPDQFLDCYDMRQVNNLCDLLKLPSHKIELSADLISLMAEHSEHRVRRDAVLNSPEAIALREEKAQLAADRKAEKAQLAAVDKISDFRVFKTSQVNGLRCELLRVKDTTVQTSGGANVPLDAAIRLLRAINAGIDVSGFGVGDFKVDHLDGDKVKIGCHLIELSEAKTVLEKYLSN